MYDQYSPIRKPEKKKAPSKRPENQKAEKQTGRLSAERTTSNKCKRKINCSLMGLYKTKAVEATRIRGANYNSVRRAPGKEKKSNSISATRLRKLLERNL